MGVFRSGQLVTPIWLEEWFGDFVARFVTAVVVGSWAMGAIVSNSPDLTAFYFSRLDSSSFFRSSAGQDELLVDQCALNSNIKWLLHSIVFFRHHGRDFCMTFILHGLQLKLSFSLVKQHFVSCLCRSMHNGCLISEILIFVIRKQIALVRMVKTKGIL